MVVAAIFLGSYLPLQLEASQPKMPLAIEFEVIGDATVGRRVELRVTATPSYTYPSDVIRVVSSENVRIDGNHSFEIKPTKGKEERKSWPLTVVKEGTWMVGADYFGGFDEQSSSACCLYGVSSASTARTGSVLEDLFSDIGAKTRSRARLDEARQEATVTYTVEPGGTWVTLGMTTVSATPSLQIGNSTTIQGTTSTTIEARGELLSEGGWAFTLQTEWRVAFPAMLGGRPHQGFTHIKQLDCKWHYVKRSPQFGFKEEAVACGADSPWFIPGPGPALGLAGVFAALVLAGRRPRPGFRGAS